jgi:anthranilate synthase component 2
VISPGPCAPDDAGNSVEVVRVLSVDFPILGVCLGHQAIVQAFGGTIERAIAPVHGQTSAIHHDGGPLFAGVDNPFTACRYHSLIAARRDLPDSLRITAWTGDETIMAVAHRSLPICGIQFHPESVLTRDGMKILENFFDWAALRPRC